MVSKTFEDGVYHFTEDIFKQLLDTFQGKTMGKDVSLELLMKELSDDKKEENHVVIEVEGDVIYGKKQKKMIENIRFNLKNRIFNHIVECLLNNITKLDIDKIKTINGNTQVTERLSIDIIKKCLDELNYYYEEAGSQQSKDFRNINKINLNIEVKKTDSLTVYFNDTLPSLDTFYIIIFTGKEFKTKDNISSEN